MGRSAGNLIVVLAVSIMTVLAGAAGAGLPMQEPQVNPNAEAMAAFKARVDDYMKLHRKAASDAPSLPDGATPEQIDRHQRDLAARIAAAREGARQGEVFDAPIRRVVNEVMS